MYLSPSALRRRVHILSDRSRGVERFVFVGKLGLWGGGNGEASSSSNAHGHQTTVEGGTSLWATRRALTRMDSSIIRRTLIGRGYCSLEEVVKAFNQEDDAELRLGLAEVMRRVLYAFNDMPVRAVTDNRGAVVREYLAMCRLDSSGDDHLLLLKDFFDSLRDKLCNDALNNRYLIEAVEHALQSIDAEVFADDPNCLLQLAQFLLDAFDPQRMSFSKEMFPVQCSALHVVHQCLRILFDIGSGSWDPNRPGGLYAKFKNWSQRVIDAAGYYPVKYQAMLVQQSLTFLQSSKRSVRITNNARRIANLVYGTVGICQAVRNAVLLDFDLGNAESTASALARARENRIVREEQWYKCLYALDAVRFAAIEDPSAFGQFKDLLSSLVLEGEVSNQERCKVLRFGVVEMLTSLAIHGKDDAVRCMSAETLAGLVERTDKWDWLSDLDLFLEMLDNLTELIARGREPEQHKAHEAIEKLASNAHNGYCEGVLSEWLGGKTIKERIQSVPSLQTEAIGNRLFTQVWNSLKYELLHVSTEVHSLLKKHHCLFAPLVVRHFAGRRREYSELIEAFESSVERVIVKAVVGPGGIGKSQLAAKVFEHLRSTGSYVNDFWIPSDSAEAISVAFLQIAEYLELPTNTEIPKLVRRIHEELRKSRNLFVFDDAPDLESICDYFPLTNGHVIVTTRDSGARDWSDDTIRLDPFNKLEARDLAEKFGFGDQSHAKDLEELFDALPQYPLALMQFLSMLENDELSSPAEWLTKLRQFDASKKEAEVIKKLSAREDSNGVRGIVFVFNSSIHRISKEPGNLGSRSLDLLAKLALLDPNGVPIEWVYKWIGSEDLQQSRMTMRKSVRLLERFSHVSWDREKKQIFIHSETQLLARHILLSFGESICDTKEASEEQINRKVADHIEIIVHSIRHYIENWRTDRSNRDLWTSLAQNLSSLKKKSENYMDINQQFKLFGHMSRAYEGMCMFRKSLSYAQKALEICEHFHGDADHLELVECIKSYAVGLSRTGRDNDALPLFKRSLEMCERLHGDGDSPELVHYIKSYAAGLERTGRVNDALPLYKKALEMCEDLHGDADHPELVECINRYAVGLGRAGKDDKSLPLRKKALEMCKRLHGDADHPKFVECIKSYAVGLSRTGKDNEALSLLKRALEMCERLHGDADHPKLVECIRSYAVGLSRTGKDNEALPLRKKALEMCERLHGAGDHPELVECIKSYAVGLSRTGKDNEALSRIKRALEMCERLQSDVDHPKLVECINRYAIGLSRTGKDNEALPLYKKALEMCERLHGDADHPELVECINRYAVGLEQTGRDNEGLPFCKKALEMCERLYGDANHPELVECINRYAVGLSRTGKDNEALPLYKKALEMCDRIHGDADHPELVECINRYAVGLSRTGKDNDALPLFKSALEMCERLHGDADHPKLVECMNRYTIGLRRTGRDNEALPFYKKALEMCERLYGDADHSEVLKCINRYAVGLSKAKRYKEVLPLYKRALEMCERIHRHADHPDLIQCIKTYAIGLLKAGKFIKACSYWRRERAMRKRLNNR